MNPIAYAIPVFIVTIVVEAVMGLRQQRKIYNFADSMASLNVGLVSQLAWCFLNLAAFAIYAAVQTKWGLTPWPLDSVWLWVLALLLYDFVYYWKHRLSHEIGVFWGIHITHHSSPYFNLATALRQSLPQPLFTCLFVLPLALLGMPLFMYVVVYLINLIYQYWIHTDLIGRLGWMDRVFATPSNHRVHHGQNDYCIDANYGGIFMIWDHWFGSFRAEREDEPILYGVRTPLLSLDPFWANFHYYVDLWRQSLASPTWRGKFAVWWAPPQSHPIVTTPWHVHPSVGTQVYVAVQGVLVLPFVVHFLATFHAMSLQNAVLYACALAVSSVAICSLLEGKTWARPLEAARWLGLGLWAISV